MKTSIVAFAALSLLAAFQVKADFDNCIKVTIRGVDFLLCAGDSAITEQNTVGVATMVFADGRVRFRSERGSTFIKKRGMVTPEVNEFYGIRRGDRAITEQNSVGTVVMVFADGRMRFRSENGSTFVKKPGTVTLAVDEVDGIFRGDRAITEQNTIGTVVMVFADGRVRFRSKRGSTFIKKPGMVTPAVRWLGDLVPGKIAITDAGTVGKIIVVYADGRVLFEAENGSTFVKPTGTVTPISD